MTPISGSIFGLQLTDPESGCPLSSGAVWITATDQRVAHRVAEMQAQLGGNEVPRLSICFQVRVRDVVVLELVHYLMTLSGRHLNSAEASRWYRVDPDAAEKMICTLADKQGVLCEMPPVCSRHAVQGARRP